MSKNNKHLDSGIHHPDIVNFNIAELNKDWLKSEIWNKKWVLVNSIIFSFCLDMYVLVTDKSNDLVSEVGKYAQLISLILLVVIFRLIYKTEVKIEDEVKKKGPYLET